MVDSFHVVALASRCVDTVRRRVEAELAVRRNKGRDSFYRVRRVLVMGEDKPDHDATQRLWSLLALGDPGGEVAVDCRVKESLRDFYRAGGPDEARAILYELEAHCLRPTMPPEIQKPGRTIRTWFEAEDRRSVERGACVLQVVE